MLGIEFDEARTRALDGVESGTLFAVVLLHLEAWEALDSGFISPYEPHVVSMGIADALTPAGQIER